jgi:signal transduction histidine kinase
VCVIAQDRTLPLTRVSEIRHLSREEAAEAYPVEFSGVVLWKGLGSIVVDDGEQSIWITMRHSSQKKVFHVHESKFRPGSYLKILGHTNPGGYAPLVIPQEIQHLGTRPLRPPKKISIDQWLSGSEDSQLIELEGVIQGFEKSSWAQHATKLSMVVGGYHCHVFVTNGGGLEESQLVDAKVRVKGIFVPDHNARSQMVNLKLLTNSAKDFDVLMRPPLDPFATQRVSLNRLALFSPEANPWHRIVSQGVVTFAVPGQYFFLQDGHVSVRVQSEATNVTAGQRVEIAGFPDSFDHIACFKNARVRSLGHGQPQPPLRVTTEMILNPRGYNQRQQAKLDVACRLVTLGGVIHKIDKENDGSMHAVWIMSQERLFPAYFPLKQCLNAEQKRHWVPGAQVEITGICELKFTGIDSYKRSFTPTNFHLLLANPESLQVLELPPWWNEQRLQTAVVGIGLVSLLLLLWTWLLRRQVAQQSRLIGEQFAHAAVHAERSRIAHDLHDSIEQQLTSVSLHLYGAKNAIDSDPQTAIGTLDLARSILKHTQRETRHSIRNLRSPLLENRSLADALHALSTNNTYASGPLVKVLTPQDLHRLHPDTEYHLLRIAQEALGNAIKHAHASHITVSLDRQPSQMVLTVTDDGQGFDPASIPTDTPSHFGLLGMRERAIKIGAMLDVRSTPSSGTTITVTLPLPPS